MTLCRDTVHPGLQYGAQRPATRTVGARHGARQGPMLRYKVLTVTGGDDREAATRPGRPAIQRAVRTRQGSGLRHDRLGLRHGQPQATIRPVIGPRHGRYTTGLGAVRAACARRLG